MKQDAQTNQTKPTKKSNETQTNPHTHKKKTKKKKNQIKPPENTHSLCGFRFS